MPTEVTIYVRATRAAVRRAVASIPAAAVSGGPLADTVLTRAGVAILGTISQAFRTKMLGGTDEAGDRWRQLSPETLRRRRSRKNYSVDILRETSLLLRSLTPRDDSPPDIPESVFRVRPGEAIIGTNRPWARSHHKGTKRIPQRRIWPAVDRWPGWWYSNIAEHARDGLVDLAIFLIKRSQG